MSSTNYYRLDLHRYWGDGKGTLLQRLFPAYEIRFIHAFRKSQCHPKSLYWKMRLRAITKKTQIQIPACVEIGEGLCLLHLGRIVINHHVKIGKNCTISPGVLIGQEERGTKFGSPVIGDNVWIGTNAAIVGHITIGNDVLISPNAFVNFNVPDHSIVYGNPGTVVARENATAGYLKNPV